MTKILVTGGLGFIGHHIVSKLEKLCHTVILVDSQTNYGIIPKHEVDYLIKERKKIITTPFCYKFDICEQKNMEWLFTSQKFDIVIHMASFPRQKIVNKHPTWGSRTMSQGLLNILELSKTNNVKKFVYVSSSMVYGNFINNTNEDYVCQPEGQYGILKLAGEWLVKDYAKKGNFNYTIIRPSAVYGPLDVTDRVLSKFFLQAMHDQILYVNGIHEELDFTYVDDVANGIVSASLSDYTFNKTYNITRGVSHTLYHAAELIVDIVGKGDIEIRERDLNFPSRGSLNIDSACRDFNYDPKVDIEEGFVKYYDWLCKSKFWRLKT